MENPSPQLAQTLANAAPIGMALVDTNGKLTWGNPALAKLAGKPLAELGGLRETDLLEYQQDTGERVLFPATGRLAQRTASQGNGGLAVFYVDITEHDKLARQLQRYDTVEPVSGLLNAQALAASLEPLVTRSRRYDNPLSVVTMVITNLTGAGDADKVIVAVSQLLRDQLRWADMIGRNNDGDFVFVLPETDADAARALTKKIAAQLDGLAIPAVPGFRPQARFGIAQWARGDDTALLLKRSVEALGSATHY